MSTAKNTKLSTNKKINLVEALRDQTPLADSIKVKDIKNSSQGIINQLLDHPEIQQAAAENPLPKQQEKKPKLSNRQEFSIFNYQHYYENEVVKKQIKELIAQIRQEINLIKKADASLLNEIKAAEHTTINIVSEKPGIYHVRFLEILIRILQSIRAKIGESKTWLQAMISKKKKRGSLFLNLSKKKGTQYSLSQELTNARSIQ